MDEKQSLVRLTCNNPNFIHQYFQQSRLHHLSTWKADLSEFVGDLMKRSSQSHKPSSLSDYPRVIMHVDMDCFFASVGIRDRPDLRDKPVAVAHSIDGMNKDFSTSEIASCNYLARARGVKNGSFIGSAKALAPDLVVIPYEFEKYDDCSRELYRILIENSDFVQAVSCDEAYIDISFIIQQQLRREGFLHDREVEISNRLSRRIQEISVQLADTIRDAIFRQTRCTASVGISYNLLLARVATAKAKPNGRYFLSQENAIGFLQTLLIKDLPGIGYATTEKCAQLNIFTCGDLLRNFSLRDIQREFGERTGQMMCEFAHGRDDRILENKSRQTIGAEINWGIRFVSQDQVDTFLDRFSEEVFQRLQNGNYMAKHLTVTAKRKLYEGEPSKFLGCGHCQDLSHSLQLNQFITSVDSLKKYVAQEFKELALLPTDIRGIGIHLKKLQKKEAFSGVAEENSVNAGKASIHNAFAKMSKSSAGSIMEDAKQLSNEEDDEYIKIADKLIVKNNDNEYISKGSQNQLSIQELWRKSFNANRNNNISVMVTGKDIMQQSDKSLNDKNDYDVDVIDLCEDNDQSQHVLKSPLHLSNMLHPSLKLSSNQKMEASEKANDRISKKSSITNFFTAKNSSVQPVKKRSISSISASSNSFNIPEELKGKCDESFLMALPEDIRGEQIALLLQNAISSYKKPRK